MAVLWIHYRPWCLLTYHFPIPMGWPFSLWLSVTNQSSYLLANWQQGRALKTQDFKDSPSLASLNAEPEIDQRQVPSETIGKATSGTWREEGEIWRRAGTVVTCNVLPPMVHVIDRIVDNPLTPVPPQKCQVSTCACVETGRPSSALRKAGDRRDLILQRRSQQLLVQSQMVNPEIM